MATSTDILLTADTWSADIALGAAELIIQPDTGFAIIAYIGAAAPAPESREGIEIPKAGLRLDAPLLSPGDKVYLLSKVGPGGVTVVRSMQAAQPVADVSYATRAPAYAQVTVTSTAQTLAQLGASVPAWATMAIVTPETGPIRYRADGAAPTASVGQQVAQGQIWPVAPASAITALLLIAAVATTVSIEFRG